MMSLNRYRLRHMARSGDKSAKRVMRLLARVDRLLGIILIGNTFANILASAVATIIAVHFFGDLGVLISTIALTLIILIFAEITPKTIAAIHPQKIAAISSGPLSVLLKILYPIVWFANTVANSIIKLLHIKVESRVHDPLSSEELQTVVREAGTHIGSEPQDILLRVLELEKVTVDDVMIPRNEIVGIDLEDEWDDILHQLTSSHHTRLVLYRDDINDAQGMIHLRQVLALFTANRLSKTTLINLARDVYFVPEGTPLSTQLLNFKKEEHRTGLVVDEYGDIQGLVTLEDILEEIVGEFASEMDQKEEDVFPQKDGSFLILGSANIRELNREMNWDLPIEGAKTLSGLIVEFLEDIPKVGTGVCIGGYPMEVAKVGDNMVKLVRFHAKKRKSTKPQP